jgi:hypothetical protein
MIKASQLAQQMIDFQKFSFLSCYDAAAAMQDQATSAMDLMLTQAAWVPSEGRQAISAWMDTCQQERDRLKAYVEKSYTSLDIFFTDKPAPAPAKTKKPAAPKEKKTVTTQPIKAAPAEVKKAAPVEVEKIAPIETNKATPVETKKAVPVETKKAVPVETKKAVPVETKKAVPVETKKAVLVEPHTTKTAAVRRTGAAKNQSKKILK